MHFFLESTRTTVNINDCPAEIHIAIAEYCSFNETRNLCFASKRLYADCLPLLYRTIDLSFHNRGTIDFSYRYGTQLDYEFCEPNEIPMPNPTTRPMRVAFELYNRFEKVDRTHPKQAAFLRTLLAHPEYATYVRTLRWTLLSWSPNVPTSLQLKEPIQKPMQQIWTVLRTLRNVKTLDLAYLSNHLLTDLSRQCPRALFPNATDIRLQGMMEHYHAASILHAVDPAKLTSLSLDNLYDCGRPRGPFVHRNGLWTPAAQQEAQNHPAGSPPQQAPAPMSSLLVPLAGRCPSLRALTLRAALDPHAHQPSYDPARNAAYPEWARFLASTRRTLEHFRFEQRPTALSRTVLPPGILGNAAALALYCLDLDFHHAFEGDLVGPGKWPRLKRLEVKGVSVLSDGAGLGETVRRELRGRVGGAVEMELHVKKA